MSIMNSTRWPMKMLFIIIPHSGQSIVQIMNTIANFLAHDSRFMKPVIMKYNPTSIRMLRNIVISTCGNSVIASIVYPWYANIPVVKFITKK